MEIYYEISLKLAFSLHIEMYTHVMHIEQDTCTHTHTFIHISEYVYTHTHTEKGSEK